MEQQVAINENDFIFTNLILGVKGMPSNTLVLLVNNIPDNSLDLIYSIGGSEEEKQTIKLPINSISNISFNTKVRMQNINRKIEENETKSALLSAVVFGGNPLLQLAGNSGFNGLFESLSNNYNKVDYNAYYEIVIEASINGEYTKFVLIADQNPEDFINQVLVRE